MFAQRTLDALKTPTARYAIGFGAIALVGAAALVTPWVNSNIVAPFTQALVVICATLAGIFDPNVQAAGVVLSFRSGVGGVEVANGCNAVEVCMLLAAAILPFPATWKQRAIGLALCAGAVQAVNLLRIISLLYLSRHAPDLFNIFHLYVWDSLIVLDGVLVFFLWLRMIERKPA